jgi:hypothetical protein
MKVRLGDEADPESSTMRVPVAVTVAFGFRTPFSVIVPLLRVIVTVVVFVGGTLIVSALGLADVEFPANDHCRWYEGRNASLPPPSTALRNQEPWMPEHDAP